MRVWPVWFGLTYLALGLGGFLAVYAALPPGSAVVGLVLAAMGPILLVSSIRAARGRTSPLVASWVAAGHGVLLLAAFIVILVLGLLGGDLDILPAMILGPILIPAGAVLLLWAHRLRHPPPAMA